MRSGRSLEDWLADIVAWGEKLARHIEGMDREAFLSDEKTQDAVTKCAEAIGNAAKEVLAVAPDFDQKHPSARLASAYASRNRLNHGYFSIDYDMLWVTASQSIPTTVEVAKRVMTASNPKSTGAAKARSKGSNPSDV